MGYPIKRRAWNEQYVNTEHIEISVSIAVYRNILETYDVATLYFIIDVNLLHFTHFVHLMEHISKLLT